MSIVLELKLRESLVMVVIIRSYVIELCAFPLCHLHFYLRSIMELNYVMNTL